MYSSLFEIAALHSRDVKIGKVAIVFGWPLSFFKSNYRFLGKSLIGQNKSVTCSDLFEPDGLISRQWCLSSSQLAVYKRVI